MSPFGVESGGTSEEGVGDSGGEVEVGLPPLSLFSLSFLSPVLEGAGESEGESFPPLSFPPSFFPPFPVGTGGEAVDDTSGELLVEGGRESVEEGFGSFPPLLSPPLGGGVEETAGDETEELGVSEETLVGRLAEDVESIGGIEEDAELTAGTDEDGTASAFC